MKLQEGAYENIITKELQGDISQAENNGLVCKQEDIDNSEAPSMLAEHINKLVINRLSDESLTAEERKDFVNSLIEFIGAGNEEKVVDEKMLSAVLSKQEEVRLKVTKQDIIRPLTGFRISNLFTGGHSNVPLNVEIERDIEIGNYDTDKFVEYIKTHLDF